MKIGPFGLLEGKTLVRLGTIERMYSEQIQL